MRIQILQCAATSSGPVRGAVVRLGLLMAAIAVFSACAAKTPALEQSPPPGNPSWSLENSGERIEWIRTISDSQDLEGHPGGFWNRLRDLAAGAGKQGMTRPYGVFVDKERRMYVSDPGAHVVHCMDLAKGRYSVLGGDEKSPLRTPVGLAGDDGGRLYITDSTAGMVFRHDPANGSLRPLLAKRLGRPTGIVFSPSDRLLYVVDTLASQIVVLDLEGTERRRIGNRGDGTTQFNYPTDIAVNPKGELYVLDVLNYRVSVITPEGQSLRQFGEPGDADGYFGRPKGLALDRSGRIYVGDSQKDDIQVFNGKGVMVTAFGRNGSGKGRFWGPSGIFIDSREYIYVTDAYNRRVQVFRHVSDNESETHGEPDFDSLQ